MERREANKKKVFELLLSLQLRSVRKKDGMTRLKGRGEMKDRADRQEGHKRKREGET